ncbi:hypothetical protein [Streptomyces glaucescens]|uniref:hypothetical protein n=1 Tax=Streptomyces glaucescens TaxID=1907 RepID=UPI0005BD139C|nr:hypothetical protein [Streptomyces glaucescens]
MRARAGPAQADMAGVRVPGIEVARGPLGADGVPVALGGDPAVAAGVTDVGRLEADPGAGVVVGDVVAVRVVGRVRREPDAAVRRPGHR